MNAPFTPPSKAEQEARKLAADILAGDTQPYGSDSLYSAREWIAAAQYLTDSDDWSEVSYMMGQETMLDSTLFYADGSPKQAWFDQDDTYAGEWR